MGRHTVCSVTASIGTGCTAPVASVMLPGRAVPVLWRGIIKRNTVSKQNVGAVHFKRDACALKALITGMMPTCRCKVQNAGVVAMCLDICQIINHKDYESHVVAMCLDICQVINHNGYESRVVAMCLDICQVINHKDYKSCVVAMCLDICQVINHKDYKSREEFDTALNDSLMAAGIEIVCLAGFMRILTGENLTR